MGWLPQDKVVGRDLWVSMTIRKKWRNSVLNADAYNTFSSLGSDHRVVSMKVRLSLRVPKRKEKCPHYDWKLFAARKDLQSQYSIEIRNRFQILEDEEYRDPTEQYHEFITANKIATEKYVPRKAVSRKPLRSRHPTIMRAREKLNQAQAAITSAHESDSADLCQAVDEARRSLYSAYDQLLVDDLEEKATRIEQAYISGQHGVAWKVVNEVSGRKKSPRGQIAGSGPEERVDSWFNHFKELLGGSQVTADNDQDIPEVLCDLGIDDSPFTSEEYNRVKATLKLGKSAGPDNIPTVVYKTCDLDDIILSMCNQTLINDSKPDQWSLSDIIPIPKSGNLSNKDNYRGISLT